MYNYNKLLGKAKECGLTLEDIAGKIGLNVSTLSLKLNNKSEFRQKEMKAICELLNIHIKDISEYFFCSQPSENQSKLKQKGGKVIEKVCKT